MISREGARRWESRHKRREKNRELVVSQGWRHFVALWGNSLDSGHQHENKLSFTHLHSAGNRADSHVAKLDATGQEKQCSGDTLLIISYSLGSIQWSHFLSPPLLFVFDIVWCEWVHIHPGDGGQPTYILACWRLMTGNRNSPEKHADDLTASTNTLAKSRSTGLVFYSLPTPTEKPWEVRKRPALHHLLRSLNASCSSTSNLRLAPPSWAQIIISMLFSRGMRSSQCNNPPTLHWTR